MTERTTRHATDGTTGHDGPGRGTDRNRSGSRRAAHGNGASRGNAHGNAASRGRAPRPRRAALGAT